MSAAARVPVLVAVPGPAESALVAGWEALRRDVVVARRCADLAEVLAAAAAGVGRAVVLGDDLPGADAETVDACAAARVALVVLLPAGAAGEAAERRWRSCGARWFVAADAGAEASAGTVLDAVESVSRTVDGHPPQDEPVPWGGAVTTPAAPPSGVQGVGRTLAVWGPHGSTGRTTLAVNVAAELGERGAEVLLVDLDSRGAAVGQLLGVLDEAPGVLAAVRSATDGRLDVAALQGLAPGCLPGVAVLTGAPDPARWSELRPAGVRRLLEVARPGRDWVVLDLPGGLEEDAARDETTRAALEASDAVLVVGSADPVGLQRWIRTWQAAGEVAPEALRVPVLNRVRSSAVGAPAERRVRSAVRRFAQVEDVDLLPEDAAADAGALAGRALLEEAPRAALRLAVRDLALRLERTVEEPGSAWPEGLDPGFDQLLARG